MKKLAVFAAVAALFVSCADSKVFTRSDGTQFTILVREYPFLQVMDESTPHMLII